MTPEVATILAKAVFIASMMMNAFGEAWIVVTALKAIGRNPQLESSLFSKVIIGVALVESTAIYSFVAFFVL